MYPWNNKRLISNPLLPTKIVRIFGYHFLRPNSTVYLNIASCFGTNGIPISPFDSWCHAFWKFNKPRYGSTSWTPLARCFCQCYIYIVIPTSANKIWAPNWNCHIQNIYLYRIVYKMYLYNLYNVWWIKICSWNLNIKYQAPKNLFYQNPVRPVSPENELILRFPHRNPWDSCIFTYIDTIKINHPCRSSWWFQPVWKILVKLDHFPSKGKTIKCLKPPPRDIYMYICG